jgi:hypothetical protein
MATKKKAKPAKKKAPKKVTRKRKVKVQPVEDKPSVAILLMRSHSFHEQAKQMTSAVNGHRVVTRALDLGKLREALDLRLQAEAQDPGRMDQAWLDEQRLTPPGSDTHKALMAFYREKLG